jgi:hypothetical protein
LEEKGNKKIQKQKKIAMKKMRTKPDIKIN